MACRRHRVTLALDTTRCCSLKRDLNGFGGVVLVPLVAGTRWMVFGCSEETDGKTVKGGTNPCCQHVFLRHRCSNRGATATLSLCCGNPEQVQGR